MATGHDSDEKQQSSTFIEWCDDADNWGDEPIVEENGNDPPINSQAIEICPSASAELETPDTDDNVVVESVELPNTDVLQLLDSRKEVPSVSCSILYILIVVIFLLYACIKVIFVM